MDRFEHYLAKGGIEMQNENELKKVLHAFGEWLHFQGKSENTVKTYIGVLEKFQEWLVNQDKDLQKITRDEVQSYINYLESLDRSAATIEKTFATISVFARYLEKSVIVHNIERKEKEKNMIPPETLNQSERDMLLKEVKRDGNLRNIAIVYTLLHTGIRISELCSLNRSDIDFKSEKGRIFIRNTDQSVRRVIPLSRDLRIHLERYIDSLNSEIVPLFVSSVNKRMTNRAVQYMLKKYNVNPHKLRHTFCNQLVENGIDLATVAELAGHSDINVTKRYVRSTSLEAVEEAIDKTF